MARQSFEKSERFEGSTAKKTTEAMNLAFPDANIEDFDELIANINLPDSEDRHEVACAMKSKSEMIITFNLKDFPDQELSKFGMKAIRPDDLILNLLSTSPQLVCKGFRKMINRLQNPIKTEKEILASLKKCSFTKGITELRNLC